MLPMAETEREPLFTTRVTGEILKLSTPNQILNAYKSKKDLKLIKFQDKGNWMGFLIDKGAVSSSQNQYQQYSNTQEYWHWSDPCSTPSEVEKNLGRRIKKRLEKDLDNF
ncbi:hypothetical protein PNOK_0706900 [Pyrrhoderma noxium]|uniref:Uncharacterized protein n=1 Tax=Pyrrhoderma noxium TaxID=2282107 RepID=A0A286UBV1_9AGAM|nr:hypothetical protein PNOK_0706900 [Pyrrhoderma noxium]